MKKPKQEKKPATLKTKKNSTDPKKVTKKQRRRELDSELSMYCWDETLYRSPPERLNLLGDDLLLMLEEDEKMVTTMKWLRKHKLTKRQVDHYVNKYPEFKERWLEAKFHMGWRIWERAYNKHGDANMAKFMLPHFGDDFREVEEWRSFLKQKEIGQAGGITVVEIPTFKPSGLVPDKKDNDE